MYLNFLNNYIMLDNNYCSFNILYFTSEFEIKKCRKNEK